MRVSHSVLSLLGFAVLTCASVEERGAIDVLALAPEQLNGRSPEDLANGLLAAIQGRPVNQETYDDFLISRELTLKIHQVLRQYTFNAALSSQEQAAVLEATVETIIQKLECNEISKDQAWYFLFPLVGASEIHQIIPYVSSEFQERHREYLIAASVAAGTPAFIEALGASEQELVDIVIPHLASISTLALYFPNEQNISSLIVIPAAGFDLKEVIKGVALFSENVPFLDILFALLKGQGQSDDLDFMPWLMSTCFSYGRTSMMVYLYQTFYQPSNKYSLTLSHYLELSKKHKNEKRVLEFIKTFRLTIVKSFPSLLQDVYNAVRANDIADLKHIFLTNAHAEWIDDSAALIDLPILAITNFTMPDIAALLQIFIASVLGPLEHFHSVLNTYPSYSVSDDWVPCVLHRAIIKDRLVLVMGILQWVNCRFDALDSATQDAALDYLQNNVHRIVIWAQLKGLRLHKESTVSLNPTTGPCGNQTRYKSTIVSPRW